MSYLFLSMWNKLEHMFLFFLKICLGSKINIFWKEIRLDSLLGDLMVNWSGQFSNHVKLLIPAEKY